MTKAFTLQQAGEISNLKLKSVDLPEPLEDEVQVKHLLIGVNRFDLHYVKGDYQTGTFPFTPGIEALGIITKKGSKAKEFEINFSKNGRICRSLKCQRKILNDCFKPNIR